MSDSWPTVGRIIHFAGGVRGENPPQDRNVYIHPIIPNRQPIIETLESYGSLFQLTQYGLIVGVEFYHRPEEVHGVYPPEWRQYTYNKGAWLGFEASQQMAEIRNAAYRQQDYDFIDRLSKVEAWAKATARALRGISESYYLTLSAQCREKEYNAPQAFDDMNCDYICDSVHNFLYYAGTLRDHIAEFIIFCIASDVPSELKKNPTMAKLKFFLEKSKKGHGIESIKREIISGYDLSVHSDILPGWLYMLKKYRNIITHEQPIDSIAGKSWVWKIIRPAGDRDIPNIKFPIPLLPLSKTDYFQDVDKSTKEKIKRFAPSEVFMMNNPDGLEVAWRMLLQILIFLDKVLEMSPVKPEPIVFDRSNSWGFRQTR